MWTNDGYGNYVFKPKDKVVCGMHPKPTVAYLKYLGMEYFGNEKNFQKWFSSKNFWHGGTAPNEIPLEKAIERLLQAIHGVYI